MPPSSSLGFTSYLKNWADCFKTELKCAAKCQEYAAERGPEYHVQAKAYRCRICPTEFVVDSVEDGQRDILRVTSYTNFGDGVSPFRGEWKRLVKSVEKIEHVEPEETVPEELDIRRRFEIASKNEPERERPALTRGTEAWY